MSEPGTAYASGRKDYSCRDDELGHQQRNNIGQSYIGDCTRATAFFFDGNGKAGTDAFSGTRGLDGGEGHGFAGLLLGTYGMAGSPGTNAGPAGHGTNGADWRIFLKTVMVHPDGHFAVFVNGVQQCGGEELLADPNRNVLHPVPLKTFQKVDWSACGGRGGHGGNGGDGGNGSSGWPGTDATQWSRGTNGGRGGNGGDGGLGSHGGNGGHGG